MDAALEKDIQTLSSRPKRSSFVVPTGAQRSSEFRMGFSPGSLKSSERQRPHQRHGNTRRENDPRINILVRTSQATAAIKARSATFEARRSNP